MPPSKHIRLLLESSYDLEPLSPFLLFPVEGFLEFDAKEARNLSRVALEADELMSCHLDGVTGSVGHGALRCAASVARTGMYASQRSDDVHSWRIPVRFHEVSRGCELPIAAQAGVFTNALCRLAIRRPIPH